MLGKLIKHDFRSLSRILIPTQLVILGATVIATAAFSFNLRTEPGGALSGIGLEILQIISAFMSLIMLLAIIAASILVAFIIFYRFYKSFMSDEGYLTFTLPVKTTHLLWSKLITAIVWSLISCVVIFISLNIFILFGTSETSFLNLEFYRKAAEFISKGVDMLGGQLVLPVIELILMIFFGAVYTILHVYLALIIGGVVTQKHKLLAGIGFYFAINIVVGIISTVAQFLITPRIADNLNALNGQQLPPQQIFSVVVNEMQLYFLLSLGITLVLSAAFFIASNYLIKNRLNLE